MIDLQDIPSMLDDLVGFPRLDLVALVEQDPPEYDYLLDGFLEYGELCWLSGRGKSGKSLVALALMKACLSGTTFLGRDVGMVDWGLYIDAENRAATVHRRVHLVGIGADEASRIDYRPVRGVDLGSEEGMAALSFLIDRPGRGLVILDSLIALHRAEENTASEVRQFVDKLRKVFEGHGCTVLGLAHENRAGDMRGSLDWRNSADRILELSKASDGTRELRIGDVRDGPDDIGSVGFKLVSEEDPRGNTRLRFEPTGSGPVRATRTKADQLADQVVLLLTGDPTLSRAKVAQELGFSRDHGTFRRAWTTASRVLETQGGQSGPG